MNEKTDRRAKDTDDKGRDKRKQGEGQIESARDTLGQTAPSEIDGPGTMQDVRPDPDARFLPIVERGRSFPEQALKKRARLPRTLLIENVDSASGLPADTERETDAAPNLSNETHDDA